MIARAKRQKVFARIGLAMVGGVIATVVGVAGATALQGRHDADVGTNTRREPNVRQVASTTPEASAGSVTQQGTSRVDSTPAAVVAPVIGEGRSELRDSLFALRDGANVEVHFDRPMARTRRADKFERIVRATLPQVYGASADSILGRIREGEIAGAGDLLNDLPQRGLHWPVGNGMTMSLYPVTRPGQDGPLVVTYRVSVANTP